MLQRGQFGRVRRFLALIMSFELAVVGWPIDAAGDNTAKLTEDCSEAVGGDVRCRLFFHGIIELGDATRIEQRVLASKGTIDRVWFNSPGGAAFEGVKIGEMLNRYFIEVAAPICAGERLTEACLGLPVDKGVPAMCASACAFAVLVADFRSAGETVFLHRPYFPDSLFAGLSASKAREKYQSMSKSLVASLRARGVSEGIINAIMETPSTQARPLGPHPRFSPWLEEWLSVKCGIGFSVTEEKRRSDLVLKLAFFAFANLAPLSVDEEAEFDRLSTRDKRYSGCAWNALTLERKRAQTRARAR